MAKRTLLHNGMINTHGNELTRTDLLLESGKIEAIGIDLSELADSTTEVFDLKQNLIIPGLIDVHVHFREPGFEEKETIKTGSLAAAHGGYTQVCAMPNLNPTPDTAPKMETQIAKNSQDGVVKIHQYAPITKGRVEENENNESSQLVDFVKLKQAGAFGFSNDGSGIQNARTMYLAMQQAQKVGLPICAHTEDLTLVNGGVIRESAKASELKLPATTPLAESVQVARDLNLAQKTGCHYHVCHISTIETINLIRQAKKDGINVTCEVTPHHLMVNTRDILADDAFWKMNPPLATPQEHHALLEALFDGTIDLIATDHAPHTLKEKETNFTRGAFGITGLDFAFPLLYSRFVKTNLLSLERLLQLMSKNPAQIFGLSGGEIRIGAPADLAIFDLHQEEEITSDKFASKSWITPFLGMRVNLVNKMTFVDGNLVWDGRNKFDES